MSLKILATADIHAERLDMSKMALYLNYFTKLIEVKKPDLFIVAGDTTDSRNLKAESYEYEQISNLVKGIVQKCVECSVRAIFLEGTPSHDGKIVKNIISINNLKADYIESLSVEYIKGYKFLFLPEMYCKSYSDFEHQVDEVTGGEPVDVCCFHAMFDYPIPALKQIDSPFNQSRTVVIDTDNFQKKHVKIMSFGGHVHASLHRNNNYYLGRFINEIHQSPDSDMFGAKTITIKDDNTYTITNTKNPYCNVYDFCDVHILRGSTIKDVYAVTAPFDKNTTVFKFFIENDRDCRRIYKQWRKQTKSPHCKTKTIYSNVTEIETDVISKVDSTRLDATDVDQMILELYKKETGEDLEPEVLVRVKGDE